MGYTTDFSGEFSLEPALKPEQVAYLQAFCDTRRMRRDPSLIKEEEDHLHLKVGLPLGPEGSYFVNGTGMAGQDRMDDIQDYNCPPGQQPGLWCHWRPHDEGDGLEWDYGEKFYYYVEWLAYMISHFFAPWGITLNGEVEWFGEEPDDRGLIIVKDNKIDVKNAVISYE